MVNKDKISKVDVYDVNKNLILTVKEVYFPKDFFKIRGKELVLIKGKDLPLLGKGQYIELIFEYINGTRVKYETTVDIGTEQQINFHLSDGVILEERRRSFKVCAEFEGVSNYYIRNNDAIVFEEPLKLKFRDINIGGTYFYCEVEFEPEDMVMMSFLDGKIEVMAQILRKNKYEEQHLFGYGSKFLDITPAQEEAIARFLIECQLIEREKRRKKNEGINNI